MGAAAGAATRSVGCGTSAKLGVINAATTDGNKVTRNYVLQVPANYDPGRAYPLVFVFHAWGGNSAQSASWGLQDNPAARGNALFVFPVGIQFQKFGLGWDDRTTGYDLPFFDNMVKDVEAGYCIDTTRIFAAGFSWGGDFAIVLACTRGDVVRAVAANSTTDEFSNKNDYRTYQDLPCPGTQHPAIRFGHAADGDPQYPPPFFATTSKLLQFLNGCGGGSTPVPAGSPLSCVSYTACKSATVECTFPHALGHVLPPNWPADTWAFFMQQAP